MAIYTNVSQRLIHAPDGTMMVPGMACDLADECSGHQGIQDLVDTGDLVEGEPPDPEEMKQRMLDREAQRQEQVAVNPEVERATPPPADVTITRTTTVNTAGMRRE